MSVTGSAPNSGTSQGTLWSSSRPTSRSRRTATPYFHHRSRTRSAASRSSSLLTTRSSRSSSFSSRVTARSQSPGSRSARPPTVAAMMCAVLSSHVKLDPASEMPGTVWYPSQVATSCHVVVMIARRWAARMAVSSISSVRTASGRVRHSDGIRTWMSNRAWQ